MVFLSKRQNVGDSKLKELANDNFKFDENGKKLFKRVRNTVGKGEISLLLVMSNFSFSHSVFKRLLLQTLKNQGLFGKGLKLLICNKRKQMKDFIFFGVQAKFFLK